ncbi:MAG: hypothetical protein ACK4S4_01510 [Pyrinomonadaceae bacterium]
MEVAHILTLLIALSICACLFVSHVAFDAGYGVGILSCSKPTDLRFAVDKLPTTYAYLASYYQAIAVFLLVCAGIEVMLRLAIKETYLYTFLMSIATSIFLGLSLYRMWWVIAEKSLRANTSFWLEPYDELMRVSVPADWILVCLILLSFLTTIGRVTSLKHS